MSKHKNKKHEEPTEEQTPQEELAQSQEKILRLMAELENTRRRASKERFEAEQFGILSFARDLLRVHDYMHAALDSITEEDKTALSDKMKKVLEGIEATDKTLLSVMEAHGIKRTNPLGEKFDPHLHEALFEREGGTPSEIIEVIEAGFLIGERLLRPAKVAVSKG